MRKHLSLFLVIALAMAFVAFGAVGAMAQDDCGFAFHPADCPPPCDPANPFHPCEEVQPSCRASAVRVEGLLGAIDLEPFVANANEVPCKDEDGSLLTPTIIGPVSAELLVARTLTFTGGGVAGADVEAVGISPPGIGVVSAVAFAVSDCTGTAPFLAGFSTVVGVLGVGPGFLIPTGHQDITIPGVGTLHLNEQILEPSAAPTKITVRAVWLESTNPLVDSVVVGEAIADCEVPAPAP